MEVLRDSPLGSLIRLSKSGRRLLAYPEEKDDFKLPHDYPPPSSAAPSQSETTQTDTSDPEHAASTTETVGPEATQIKRKSEVLTVTWYSDNDQENPQNWATSKKIWVSLLFITYSFAAYIGSSIYTASVGGVQQRFHVSELVASLGLSLYVFGYGLAPLVLSPLSEIPAIGRNPPYAITFCLFAILTIPTIVSDSLPGIIVVRFLLGALSSPALATVGASYGDFINPAYAPYAICMWAGCAALAPALGPLVAGFAVEAKGWRWSSLELLWLSAPVAILMLLALPETSKDTILLRRAQRLRKATGRTDLRSESEIRQAEMHLGQIAYDALAKPWQVNALDPAVLFSTAYMALAYGTFYSFFESFPLVFGDVYGFDLSSIGLAFICALVGLLASTTISLIYLRFIAPKRFAKMKTVPPEEHLWLGLFASILLPIGLFLFAWTARASIHWSVCMIGVAITLCGVIIISQSILTYVPMIYPRYAGSLFAANSASRCSFAGAAVLFSPPLFKALGIDGGVSLLAGCSVVCVFGMFGLYRYGERLRKRSKFAMS